MLDFDGLKCWPRPATYNYVPLKVGLLKHVVRHGARILWDDTTVKPGYKDT
jgi:hypothetical protein